MGTAFALADHERQRQRKLAVDERFQLAGYIEEVQTKRPDHHIRPQHFFQYGGHIVMNHAFAFPTLPAAEAAQTGFDIQIPDRQFLAIDLDSIAHALHKRLCQPVGIALDSLRTSVNQQNVHFSFPPILFYSFVPIAALF